MKGEKVVEMMMKSHLNEADMTAFTGMTSADNKQVFVLEHVSACEACKEYFTDLKDFFGSPLGEFVKRGYQSAGPKTLLWIRFISMLALDLQQRVKSRFAVNCSTPEGEERFRRGKEVQTLSYDEFEYDGPSHILFWIESTDPSDAGIKIRIQTDGGQLIAITLKKWPNDHAGTMLSVPDSAVEDLVALRYQIEVYKTV